MMVRMGNRATWPVWSSAWYGWVGCERKEGTVWGNVRSCVAAVRKGLNEEQEGTLVLYRSNCGGRRNPRGRDAPQDRGTDRLRTQKPGWTRWGGRVK